MKSPVTTPSAPAAIGPYSQAIKAGNLVFLSGQIPLDPTTMELVSSDIGPQVERVFENMKAVIEASGGTFDSIVQVRIYLVDLKNFTVVNETMKKYFKEPYPARTTIEVSGLPKEALVEVEAIMVLNN